MQSFIDNLKTVLALSVDGKTNLKRCISDELHSEFFRMFGYRSDPDTRSRGSLYYALHELMEPDASARSARTEHQLGAAIAQDLYHLQASVTRISGVLSPGKLAVLNAMLDVPAVDMTLLVNDWLARVLQPGQNQMVVHVRDWKALMLVKPSTWPKSFEMGRLVDVPDVGTLREQFILIDKTLAALAAAGHEPEPLNSEGFPGPVAGFGGH